MANQQISFINAQTLTANGSAPIAPKLSGADTFQVELNIAGPVTGTSPTLNVFIDHSVDNGATWNQVIAFAQQVAVTSSPVLATLAANTYGESLRARWVVGGTASPSFGGVTVEMG